MRAGGANPLDFDIQLLCFFYDDWGLDKGVCGFDWWVRGFDWRVRLGVRLGVSGFDWWVRLGVRGFDWWVRLGVREILGDYVTILDEGVVQECVVVRLYFGALHFD